MVDNARFVHVGCGVNALSDLQKRKIQYIAGFR
ncbi:malate:quinone oxidoreductase [Escherichia albertii]|nr:malate:quinone oxidoreductase [Escherichia albertii]